MDRAIPPESNSVYGSPSWLRRLQVWHVVAPLIAVAFAVVISPLWFGYLPDSLVHGSELREARRVIERWPTR